MRRILSAIRQLPPLVLVLFAASIAVVAYLQAFDYPFIYDDKVYISDNPALAGLRWTELWRIFTQPYNSAFEFLPLRDLSFWIEINLFGQNPSAFRIDNILLYLLCLALIYGVTSWIWKYFRPTDVASAPWVAASVTALFALHPALVESVVWISGRKYILPDLFSLLALWLALRAKRETGLSAAYAIAALIAFVAVMFSKSSYVGMALLIALFWVIFWCDMPQQNRRRSLLLWPLAILILAALLIRTFIVFNHGYDSIPFYFGIEALTRSLAALGWLTRLALSPERHYLFYPVFEDPWLPLMVGVGATVLLAAGWGTVMLLRKRSLEGFAVVAFLLLCLPYMQLFPHAPPALVSDRYVALALWPAILLLVTLSWRLSLVYRTLLLLVIALLWGYQTIERPRDWRNFETLINSDLHNQPGYYMPAMYEVTSILLPRASYREADEIANSITMPEPREMVQEMIKAHYAVNVAAPASGKPQEAMALLWELGIKRAQPPEQAKWNPSMRFIWQKRRQVLMIEWGILSQTFPEDVFVRYNAGLWMLELHEYKSAVINLRAATESPLLPQSVRAKALAALGSALMNAGRVAEAEAPLRAALAQPKPFVEAYCMLAEVLKQANRMGEAEQAKTECLRYASNAPSSP